MTSRDRPAIALDASPIAYKAAKGGSNPVLKIVAAIETFTELGWNTYILFDGATRHQQKRTSIERTAVREHERIELRMERIKLASLVRGLEATETTDARTDVEKQVEKSRKRVKKLGQQVANVMPLDFEQRIRDRVYHNMNKGNSKVAYITAPY